MTAWYPNDLSYRSIQASLFLRRGRANNFDIVHETELVHHLDDLHDYLQPYEGALPATVELEGAISFTVDGEELLGSQGSIEFITIAGGPNSRRADGGPVLERYGKGLRYEFSEQGNVYKFRYLENGQATRTRTLPAKSTMFEWNLMNTRLERLKAELGDQIRMAAIQRNLDRAGGIESALTYTWSAPLADVLTNPAPEHLYPTFPD